MICLQTLLLRGEPFALCHVRMRYVDNQTRWSRGRDASLPARTEICVWHVLVVKASICKKHCIIHREEAVSERPLVATAKTLGQQRVSRLTLGSQRCHVNIVFQLPLCVLIAFPRQEFHDQRVLDCEDRIIIEIFAGLVEYLCCNGLIAFGQYLLKLSVTIFGTRAQIRTMK